MEISKIKLSDEVELPIRCDLYVLSVIQEKYGSVEAFEKELVGMKEDGSTGEPSIKTILFALPMMIHEGIKADHEENGMDIPDISDAMIILCIRRNYREIAADMHQEMFRCFGIKKKKISQKNPIGKLMMKIKR